MANESRPPRLAVLIDAENAPSKIADALFEEIAKLGEASVRRIYGDFSGQQLKGWADVLAKYAIDPRQQFAYTVGKNASDITLVIEAMDLLHSGRLDGFCLVSSDSDFTRLAARIREQGIDVFGFGEQKTPESFRQACRRFIYIENLIPLVVARAEGEATPRALMPMSHASKLVTRALSELEAEWVNLGPVGSKLQSLASDFDPRTYGHSKLSELVRKLPSLELKRENGHYMVRLKPTSPAKPVATKQQVTASKSSQLTAKVG